MANRGRSSFSGLPPAAERHAGAVLGAVVALAALAVAWHAGVKGLGAVPDVARGVGATIVLLAVAGYAPARFLVSIELRPHFWLWVCLLGCVTAGLSLTVLGFLGVPFPLALVGLLTVGTLAGATIRARHGPAHAEPADLGAAGGWRLTVAWPAYLAVILISLLMIPAFLAGHTSVQGNNPDALLGVGVAKLLQKAHPSAVDADLPVDQMPLVWRSKYPIYYVLAGASTLSGLDPTQTFAAFSALLAVLTASGFMLLARYALGAPPVAALVVMGVVGLDRAVAYLALHPYHNQLWGTLALAPMLLFGLRVLDRPNRYDFALLGGFALLGLAAYPLMALFPVLALVAAAMVSHRRGRVRHHRVRRPRSVIARVGLVVGGLLALPAVLAITVGVLQKSASALDVVFSGGSLAPWRGDLDYYLSPGFFIGVTGPLGYVTAAAVLAAAVAGVARLDPAPRAAFGAMIVGGVAFGILFRLREFGEYFYFKVLAFLAPLLLVAAVAGLATRIGRRGAVRLATVAAIALLSLQLIGLRNEIGLTGLQLDAETLELRDAVAAQLPVGASVRVDMLKDGRQLWVSYVLSDHPLSTLNPLTGTTFPFIPHGRKADFIVADARLHFHPWPDAAGSPLFENESFRLYRMREGVPGRDRSSKRMVDLLSPAFE